MTSTRTFLITTAGYAALVTLLVYLFVDRNKLMLILMPIAAIIGCIVARIVSHALHRARNS